MASNTLKNYTGTFYDKDPVIDITENQVLAECAARLVKQMRLFSRKTESVKITSNINVSVNHSLKIIERTIPKMIKIETRLDNNVYPVKAEPLDYP